MGNSSTYTYTKVSATNFGIQEHHNKIELLQLSDILHKKSGDQNSMTNLAACTAPSCSVGSWLLAFYGSEKEHSYTTTAHRSMMVHVN